MIAINEFERYIASISIFVIIIVNLAIDKSYTLLFYFQFTKTIKYIFIVLFCFFVQQLI